MKKNILLSSLFITASLYGSQSISYQVPTDVKISSTDLKVYKDIFSPSNFVTDSKIKKRLLKNRVFTKAFFEQTKLDNKELNGVVTLAFEQIFSDLYERELVRKNLPDEKVLKSFYLDHKNSFKVVDSFSVSTVVFDSLNEADEFYLKFKEDSSFMDKVIADKNSYLDIKDSEHYKNVKLTNFAPQVRKWLRKHKTGDISEPIKVGHFYFINRIDKVFKNDSKYETLKDDIKKTLKAVYKSQKVEDEYKRLKEASE